MGSLSVVAEGGGEIPQVGAQLGWADRWGSWKARWGFGRMKYTVGPGVYAVGNPDGDSAVLVSANYKMSFDRLRNQLSGRDVWIMVLDTKGINVWCAAGKGAFGTEEIIGRIAAVKLDEIVRHRTLVVPQLGAPGVSAHRVKQASGFNVKYGPVRAEDLGAFLDAGMKATAEMRRVRFGMWDRVVLAPMELMIVIKYAVFMAACLFLLGGLNRGGYSTGLAMTKGLPSAVLLLISFIGSSILGPLLLPWLPGRAFAVKGMWTGWLILLGVGGYVYYGGDMAGGALDIAAWLLMVPAICSFVVMNFTGASTYTSLSGVKREMRIAVPIQLVCAISGLGLWVAGRFA